MNKHFLSFLVLAVLLFGAVTLPADASTSGRNLPGVSMIINAATFPYFDGFESGALGAEWSEYTTEEGRVRVSSDYPYAGTYSLLLDDSVDNSTDSIAAAILTIDLNGQSDVELNFWWREFGDEDDAEDGVFISDDDGSNWYPVYSFNGGSASWVQVLVDIDAQAASNGLTLNDHFQIKFQFYDNYSITSDGYAIDNVNVQTTPHRLYLPLVLNNAGPPTSAPVLSAIDNPSGDYDYIVTWSVANKANEYIVEEDDNADFSSPTIVYQGAMTSTNIGGQDLGTYYYHVKASNEFGESGWSNIESTVVTVSLPACPQAGAWSGTNNQGRNISFVVENSPRCQIADDTLRITIRDSCYNTTTTIFNGTHTITNNHFSAGSSSYGVQVIGDFTSLTTASGTFSLYMANPFPPPYNCTASGTWSASP